MEGSSRRYLIARLQPGRQKPKRGRGSGAPTTGEASCGHTRQRAADCGDYARNPAIACRGAEVNDWPMARLGDVLRSSSDWVAIDHGSKYREITVRLWGRGVVQRGEVLGSQIAAKTRLRVRAGQFILSRIDARNGAVGIVPGELDGAVVSGDFPAYEVNHDRISTNFLGWLCRTRAFVDTCRRASEGTTNRVRIKEDRLLASEIPLPPIAEQRRIVRRLQQLESKITEAQRLRAAGPDGSVLLSAETGRAFRDLSQSCATRQFREFEPHVTSGPRNWGSRIVSSGARFYRAQDIAPSFEIANGNKAFIAPPDSDQGRSARLRPNDLMLVITGATVGRCAIFTEEAEPGYVNQHVAICRFSSPGINPRFALWGLRGPSGQEQLLGQRYGQGKPGLNLNNIRAIELPVPDMAEQLRIVDYLDSVEARVKALDEASSGRHT